MDTTEEESYSRIYGILLLCVIFALAVHGCFKRLNDKKIVEKSYALTQGKIITYQDRRNSDAGSGRSITYEYNVKGKVYSRQVGTQVIFEECDGFIGNVGDECSNKRFWVAFSKEDTSKSLIRFEEIVDESFPDDIEDFE